MNDLAAILFVIAALLLVAEWRTRQSPATLRWGLVALLYLELAAMVVYVWMLPA